MDAVALWVLKSGSVAKNYNAFINVEHLARSTIDDTPTRQHTRLPTAGPERFHRKVTMPKVLLFGTSGNPPTGRDGHSGIIEYFVSLGEFLWGLLFSFLDEPELLHIYPQGTQYTSFS